MTSTMPAEAEIAAAELAAGTITMTAAVAALLREPFAPEHMGKLPKITCPDCRGSKRCPNPRKECPQHPKARCRECRNWITPAHMHLDYVGHAEVTDRLISVDPLWTWEPLAFDADGLPKFDQFGALWIRLTVAGKPMIGYGDAGMKTGPDAVKEVIGDAIRNAAMRLGVALDLWGATFKAAEDDAEAALREAAPEIADEDWETATPVHGRGVPPAEQAAPAPHVAARPVDSAPPAPTYNPATYTLGVSRIENAETLAELDQLAAHVERFAATGEVNQGEAGRLRMKIGNRRDQLRAAPAPELPDVLADQALETAQH
jgi:hypothetical protein